MSTVNVLLLRAHSFWTVDSALSAQSLEKQELLTCFSNPLLVTILKITNPSHSKEEPTKILLHLVVLGADGSLEG